MSQTSLLRERPPRRHDPAAETAYSSPASASTEAARCLSENLVVAFVGGQASRQERTRVETHLDHCPACAELVFAAAYVREAVSTTPEPPWPTAFAVGDVLSERFTIRRFVARGGMGEVYEAFDRKVPERVALKTMLCTLSDNPEAVRRLCEEVKLARRIAHRHVCRIHELHEHREAAPSAAVLHFLAMEFVDGETLKARLARGPIPPRSAGRIARQLLEGLGAAHAAGVLHLDFKSQNVMLRAGVSPPEAVIMDFSLSRAFETEAHLSVNERELVGSPGYMSPEQLTCRAVLGPPSDIYSFGVVLFEMLTGRLPFRAERAEQMMALQLERPAPVPSQVNPGLPSAFDIFVARCLSRQPGDRFADATSALAALDRCLALPLDRASRRRRLVQRAASVALLVAPLAAGAWASAHWASTGDTPAGRTLTRGLMRSAPAPANTSSANGPLAPVAARPAAPAPPALRAPPGPLAVISERHAAVAAPSPALRSRPLPSAARGGTSVVRRPAVAVPDVEPVAPAPAATGWTPQRAPARLY